MNDGFGKIRPHTIIALVEDKPGVLNRIASKWRQRGFNIESLAVGHSENPGLSRMTFVVDADTNAEQVVKQLDKLIDVVHIRDVSHEDIVSRELAMVKVKADRNTRSHIIDIAEVFKAEIVDVEPDSIIIEATGDENHIDSLVNLLRTTRSSNWCARVASRCYAAPKYRTPTKKRTRSSTSGRREYIRGNGRMDGE